MLRPFALARRGPSRTRPSVRDVREPMRRLRSASNRRRSRTTSRRRRPRRRREHSPPLRAMPRAPASAEGALRRRRSSRATPAGWGGQGSEARKSATGRSLGEKPLDSPRDGFSMSAERFCLACGADLPESGRADRRYCDSKCRKRAARVRARVAFASSVDDDARSIASATEEIPLVAIVVAEAKTNWRAAAWLLERKYPERWARVARDRQASPPAPDAADPFAEVDELARRRRAG
jgi:hypothetical protein